MHSFKQLGTKITSKKMILNFFDFAINFDETTTLKNHQRSCRMKHGQASMDNSAENLHVDDENPNVQPAAVFETDINDAYEKMTVWRKNMFQLPKGHQGKEFIKEMTKQINLWTSNSPLRHISIKCLMVMPNLLLQQTSRKSKAAENRKTLDRRLSLWREKRINELVGECLVIQSRLLDTRRTSNTPEDIAKSFHKLMIQGKVNSAIRLLSNSENSGLLTLNESTMQELHLKHPELKLKYEDLLLEGPVKYMNSVIYDEIDEEVIMKAAIRKNGAAGISSLDSSEWKRIIGSNIYGNVAIDLRKSIAGFNKTTLCIRDP